MSDEICTWCSGDGFVGVVPCRDCHSTRVQQREARLRALGYDEPYVTCEPTTGDVTTTFARVRDDVE